MIERDSVLFKRACPFCGGRIALATRRDTDNTVYLTDAETHICRDAPFAVGDEVRGFNFYVGKEVHGKITEMRPHILYSYTLDSGDVIGTHDDIYTRKGESDDA